MRKHLAGLSKFVPQQCFFDRGGKELGLSSIAASKPDIRSLLLQAGLPHFLRDQFNLMLAKEHFCERQSRVAADAQLQVMHLLFRGLARMLFAQCTKSPLATAWEALREADHNVRVGISAERPSICRVNWHFIHADPELRIGKLTSDHCALTERVDFCPLAFNQRLKLKCGSLNRLEGQDFGAVYARSEDQYRKCAKKDAHAQGSKGHV